MSRPKTFQFRPERVAYYEAAGWRAYYERDWFKLLRLVVALCQTQFQIPFPYSLLAAYYTTKASEAWAPVYHDIDEVRKYLLRFYQLARKYSGLSFDAAQVADLELKTWIAHRELAGKPDKHRFVASMIDLHCALFGLEPRQARESAQYRVLANNTVDTITSGNSTNLEASWAELQEYLRRAYVSISEELAFGPKHLSQGQPAARSSV